MTSDDTLRSKELPEVILKAFEQNKSKTDVPASIITVDKELLNRFNNVSIVNALNATSGIRMEERSPGSYRLNIRGSSLRSPFGVRNVKVYYNNIPFTDPGGNTYLNQLGFYNFGSIEVVKGPGSSLYGAGTGGVMLIDNINIPKQRGFEVSATAGSFGMKNYNVNINTGNDSFRNIINYQHQVSNGYREQSALKRDVFSWEAIARLSKGDQLSGTVLYGDLEYQTPGALTLTELKKAPNAARPVVGATPGAKEAQAAIFQKLFLAGVTYQKNITSYLKNTTTLYTAFTSLNNPAIRNYARNSQPHYGGRTIFELRSTKPNSELIWHTGAELQQAFSSTKVYRNKNGISDTLQTDDEIDIKTHFLFTQLTYTQRQWTITGGLSINKTNFNFTRLNTSNTTGYNTLFDNELAPRIAVLRKLNRNLSAYLSFSKGFSPPTSEEVFPTGSIANPNLSPERGTNYESGVKGELLNGAFSFDISAFYFKLNNSIVQRRDAQGGDYYLNAGSTDQKGIETQVSYKLVNPDSKRNAITVWANHTFYNFYYNQFKQLENDFSGNRLPGVPKNNLSAGIDLKNAIGIYSNITYQYNSRISLNDGNTAYAQPFHLLAVRVGYRQAFGRIKIDTFLALDNLLNEKYSLGNDINGFGGRYYNAAPTRNYAAGISVGYNY